MFVCMFSFEPWPAVADSKRGCVGMYSVCAFLVKTDSVVNTKGRYVGRYKERLAQQESGAALSKRSI